VAQRDADHDGTVSVVVVGQLSCASWPVSSSPIFLVTRGDNERACSCPRPVATFLDCGAVDCDPGLRGQGSRWPGWPREVETGIVRPIS
jgi:hypothetical protein